MKRLLSTLGALLALLVLFSPMGAQQTKIVFPGGASLPATCNVREGYFLTVDPAGLYTCTAANTWVLAGSTATIRRVVVTLTDAQIKTLPSTPVILVAAPAAGFRVKPLTITMDAETAGGAYVGISTVAATLAIQTTDGAFVCTSVDNDNSLATPLAALTRVLGTNSTSYFDLPVTNFLPITGGASGEAEYVSAEVGTGASNFNGKAVELFLDNNGSVSNLTGGNAVNTLKITMFYTLEAI